MEEHQINCKGYGRPSRQHCPSKWPDYPCYTRRGTCASTDGVELFEPFGEIIGIGTHAINDFITRLKALVRNTDAESIRQDPSFYIELYDTLNSYVPRFVNRNPIEQRIESLRTNPLDSQMNTVYDKISDTLAPIVDSRNVHRHQNFNKSRKQRRSFRRAQRKSRRSPKKSRRSPKKSRRSSKKSRRSPKKSRRCKN